MFDDTNYRVPPSANQPKQVTIGGFLMAIYAVIGLVVGATWPLWFMLMVTL